MEDLFRDKTVQARMEELERLVATQDEGLFDALADFLSSAEALGNPGMIGFVHYQYASAYFDLEDEEHMLESLGKALDNLLISDAREWVARSYNLFGVYAKQIGSLNMAYNYFLLAQSYVDELEGSLARAIVESNIGDILAEMGEYRKAITYTRKGLKTMKKCGDNEQTGMYEAFGNVNLSLYLLYSGDAVQSRKMLERGARLLKKEGRDGSDINVFWHLLVEAQIELAVGNRERMLELTEEVAEQIATKPVFALFTREIQWFGGVLIVAEEWDAVKLLLRVTEKADKSAASVYSRLMTARLKTDYYRARREEEALEKAREECHLMAKEIRKTQRHLSLLSAKLMMRDESVRKERDRIRGENVRLEAMAQTDALTGLPNRYALNTEMERAFEKALKNRTMFGFGIVDIDAFKQYNDNHGHAAGDACLISVADTLRGIAKKYGFFVARYGGDEFTMIYENKDDAVIREIEKEILSNVSVSVSHGYYADIPDERSRQWDYLTRADRLMYQRKRGG